MRTAATNQATQNATYNATYVVKSTTAALLPSRLIDIADMPAAFSDLSHCEVEIIAEALKGTTWLALFSRVSKVCRSAAVCAAKGDEASLRRLKARDVVCSVELVKWAIEQGCPRGSQHRSICAYAAGEAHLGTLQWLRASGFEWDRWTCSAAAGGGHLDVLKWARANGCEWDRFTCYEAAGGGHLDVLKWAMANGCPWDEGTWSYAAQGGHLNVLEWARANGCEWEEDTCALAALGGHLDVLKWLRANGCEWNARTCFYAARGGHLAVLKWARANGCPWDETGCRGHALDAGSWEVFAWLTADI